MGRLLLGESENLGSQLSHDLGSEGTLPITKFKHPFKWLDVGLEGTNRWIFPGTGEAYLTCGTFHVKGCLDHDPAWGIRVKDTCARAECPKDYREWMAKATTAIVKRIKAGVPNRYRKPIHATISPPRVDRDYFKYHKHDPIGEAPWFWFRFKKFFPRMRLKALRLAKKAGIHGGCCIFHPYREINDTGWWYWSPHFHIIGYGWVVNTGDIYNRTGWIVKNIGVRKSVGATAYYQLSHAGIKKGRKVVTWFGTLSSKALKVPKDPPEEKKTCPICGSPLVDLIYYGGVVNPFEEPDFKEGYFESTSWRYKHEGHRKNRSGALGFGDR